MTRPTFYFKVLCSLFSVMIPAYDKCFTIDMLLFIYLFWFTSPWYCITGVFWGVLYLLNLAVSFQVLKTQLQKNCIFYTYIATDSEVTKKLYRKKKRIILFQNRKTPTEKNSSTVICFFPDGCLEDVSCCFWFFLKIFFYFQICLPLKAYRYMTLWFLDLSLPDKLAGRGGEGGHTPLN